jgi:stearoyl-CoA desaturase (delta-9 desaturase)
MAVIFFFIAIWYCSLFCQTFFHHRYAAHGAFTMSKRAERFFFILSWITQGSSYLSPRAYAIMHRMHHAYADTDKDPHSPAFSKNLIDMMLQTWRVYKAILLGTTPVDEKFKKNVPDWAAFDKFADSYLSRGTFVALYIAFFWMFATSPWQWLLLPVIILMSPVHGAVINWFAHKFGYKNYEQKNTSENFLFFDFLMLGESYHNNHHKFPSDINFGKRWHEFDPIYPIIRLFAALGIVKIAKQTPGVVKEW